MGVCPYITSIVNIASYPPENPFTMKECNSPLSTARCIMDVLSLLKNSSAIIRLMSGQMLYSIWP